MSTTSSHSDRFQQMRCALLQVWLLIGLGIILLAVFQVFHAIGPAIECLIVGMLFGFMCSPITNWLEDKGIRRGLGALIAIVLMLSILASIFWFVAPAFVDQLVTLLRHSGDYFAVAQRAIHGFLATYGSVESGVFGANVQDIIRTVSELGTRMASNMASQLTTGLVPNVMAMLNSFFMAFLGVIVAFWLAKDYPKIIREFAIIAGPKHEHELTLLLAVLSRSVGGYMRGVFVMSLLYGVLTFLGFITINHPYAGLIGIISGIFHFVPVIGALISALLAMLVALFVSPMLAFETLIICIIAQNVVDNLIGPFIMQSSVKVHPVVSLIAITIGASVAGLLGMTIAIPLSAAIKGVFVYYFESRTRRQLVCYDGALFKGTPYQHSDGTPSATLDALDDPHFFDTGRLVSREQMREVRRTERPDNLHKTVVDLARGCFRVGADARIGADAETECTHASNCPSKARVCRSADETTSGAQSDATHYDVSSNDEHIGLVRGEEHDGPIYRHD